jgi:hypothetical protein
MKRFAPGLAGRIPAIVVLSLVGLITAFALNVIVESHPYSSSPAASKKVEKRDRSVPNQTTAHLSRATNGNFAPQPFALVLDVDRLDDTASATACTAAPNDCSLRGAVITANSNPGTTIHIPSGTYQLTIAGNNELFAATGDLDIRGNGTSIVGDGASTTTIQQTTNDRVFHVNPGLVAAFTFNLSGVTVKGGNHPTGSGGAILSGGPSNSTTISDSVFDSNRVTGTVASNGGAITDSVASGPSNLTITNTVFSNNSTATGSGGAIRFNSTGTLTLSRDTFIGNRASTNSGGAVNALGPGSGGTYLISQSSFVNNQANGVAARGGAALIGNGVATIAYSRIVGNTAGAGIGTAIAQSVGATGNVNAGNNWWGSNAGPSSNANFGALITNWLQLRLNASVNPIDVNSSTTLTADLLGSSAGGTVAASNLVGLPAFSVPTGPIFNNPAPVLGSISGASVQFVDGQATATYTSGAAGGIDTLTATADSETASIDITINQPLEIACPANITANTDAGSCSASVAFSATATGGPSAATVTYSVGATPITSPHIFSVGTTTVTATATSGNQTVNCSFNVTVVDNENPTITAPADITVNTGTGATSCGALVTDAALGNATANDNCSSVTVARSGVPAGNQFPVGVTTVTYTATDASGHTATATQHVTVVDNTAPTITGPANATYECAASVPAGSASQATASDNCGTPTVTFSESNNGGVGSASSPLVITRTYTATDAAGNHSSAVQTITVIDSTAPSVTAAAPITVSADANCQAAIPNVVAGSSASDNCGSSITVTQSPAAGTLVGVGTHTITITATDGVGNTSSATTTLTVNDTTAPSLTAPSNVTVSTGNSNSCGTLVSDAALGTPTASDSCGNVTISRSGVPAGNVFPVGTTTITYTATDAAGNQTTATQSVTVNDNTPPSVTAPSPITISADANCQAAIPNVTATATASDNCSGSVTLTQSPAAGTLVGTGPHTVTITATDAAGNTSTATTTVTVNDTTAPALSVPAGITVSSGSVNSCSTVVSDAALGTATANDNCSGVVSVTRSGVPAGNAFPVGTTTITYTATDAAGNTSTATQTVTVLDNTPPVITLNGPGTITLEIHTPFVDPGATASDNCAGNVPVSVSGAVNVNVVGTYTLIYNATDASGNHATPVTRTVIVQDTTAPTITLNGRNISLWAPNHQYETIRVTDLVASVSDNGDSSLGVGSVVIAQVTSDELEDSPNGGDGNTLNDIVIAPDCKSVQLRAERDGNLNGRVYTITFQVRDSAGNVGTVTAKVTVPRTQNGAGAVDDGPKYTVNGNCQ